MFWSKIKKNKFTPAYPRFAVLSDKGVCITQTCFPDDKYFNMTYLFAVNVKKQKIEKK